ncbi:hypothetical protein [Rhizobium leguminosarum]|uniref:hypothetical protein n=1 Tax=Rhizobium leguminosarum TaxID=384 RepID=UPI00103E7F6D|nr:hypothetical protein [Rhizobium leguminosarum]TBZ77006.1 hypothetical protein E0H43_06815 [Rhizobium leguminosarum bv. viciae]
MTEAISPPDISEIVPEAAPVADTLYRWRHLMDRPLSIPVARMRLLGDDHQGALVEGAGTLEFPDHETISYRLDGSIYQIGPALSRATRCRDNPYDPRLAFRLEGEFADGSTFSSSWTCPGMSMAADEHLICSGEIDGGIWIQDRQVAREPGTTEIAVHVPRGDDFDYTLHHQVGGGRVVVVLGEEIRLQYDRDAQMLTASVTASPRFRFPFAENWLVEPFRIMFAQLIFPRITARNHPDGRAAISVRPTRNFVRTGGWVRLWSSEVRYADHEGFWNLYASILAYIVRAHEAATLEIDASPITELYEEVVHATRGSRWVWAMVIASSVESLLQKLIPSNGLNPAVNAAAVEALSQHVRAWQGDGNLRGALLGTLERRRRLSPRNVLSALRRAGRVTAAEFNAWDGMRNASMHGNPVSRYASASADDEMRNLAALLHKVTLAVIEDLDLDFTSEAFANTARDRIEELAASSGVRLSQDVAGPDAVPMDAVEELLMALARAGVVNAVDAVRLHADYVAQRYRSAAP